MTAGSLSSHLLSRLASKMPHFLDLGLVENLLYEREVVFLGGISVVSAVKEFSLPHSNTAFNVKNLTCGTATGYMTAWPLGLP